MKMYDFTLAPSPRRVRIFLAEKGLDLELVQVDIMRNANRTPEFYRKNPSGSLPILELDDGSHLSESVAICRYFEEIHPEPLAVRRRRARESVSRDVESENRTRDLRAGGSCVVAPEQILGGPQPADTAVRRDSEARGNRSHRLARCGAEQSRIHRGQPLLHRGYHDVVYDRLRADRRYPDSARTDEPGSVV